MGFAGWRDPGLTLSSHPVSAAPPFPSFLGDARGPRSGAGPRPRLRRRLCLERITWVTLGLPQRVGGSPTLKGLTSAAARPPDPEPAGGAVFDLPRTFRRFPAPVILLTRENADAPKAPCSVTATLLSGPCNSRRRVLGPPLGPSHLDASTVRPGHALRAGATVPFCVRWPEAALGWRGGTYLPPCRPAVPMPCYAVSSLPFGH